MDRLSFLRKMGLVVAITTITPTVITESLKNSNSKKKNEIVIVNKNMLDVNYETSTIEPEIGLAINVNNLPNGMTAEDIFDYWQSTGVLSCPATILYD